MFIFQRSAQISNHCRLLDSCFSIHSLKIMFVFGDILADLSKFATSFVEHLFFLVPLVSKTFQLLSDEFDLLQLFELDFDGFELSFGDFLE